MVSWDLGRRGFCQLKKAAQRHILAEDDFDQKIRSKGILVTPVVLSTSECSVSIKDQKTIDVLTCSFGNLAVIN